MMRLITVSERVYRALLIAYPADFRREYAAEMTRLFRDTCRDVYRQGGAAAIVLCWLSILLDLFLTALQERRKVVSFMDYKPFLARNVGLFLIIAGLLTAVASISQLQPDDHSRYYGVFQVALLFIIPAFTVLVLGGVQGLIVRFGEPMGLAGRLSLYLTGSGGLAVVFGLVFSTFNSFFWVLVMVGLVMHAFGLTVFGLLHAWKPTLPCFRLLPLQIALGWTILNVIGAPDSVGSLKHVFAFLLMLGIGLGWLAIGLNLHRQQTEPTLGVPATAA
ncbi:MAG: hypothetical protein U0670_12010 [Anaerolineae bacterium]